MYHTYILKCSDKTLYTGITVDLSRRIKEHNTSKLGARYTSSRRPVKLVYSKKFRNRSSASKEESRIKNLSREEKLGLIKTSLYTKTTNHLTTKTMGKGDNRQQKNKKKPKQNKKK
ncbi:MAG: GIY-YIG nuclease family protein [Candidatus Gracilibacteria bacterium]|jgi:putative endonuclease